MKTILALIFICSAAFGLENYQFPNMTKVEDMDFQREVVSREGYSFIVFNNGICPRRNPRRCHEFEWQLNYFAVKMSERNPKVKFFNQDIHFNYTFQDYLKHGIKKFPSVVVLRNGSLFEIFEPSYCHYYQDSSDCHLRQIQWRSEMLQDILDFFHQLPQ